MNPALFESIDPRGFLLKHLSAGVRPDGRANPPFSSRKITISANKGKSTVRIGKNCATCVVHPLLGEPASSMPRQGRLTVSVDMAPAPDQSRRQTQQLSSWVSSKVGAILQMGPEVFDPSQLCVVEGQVVWQLHLVITVLAVDGSLMDLCLKAAVEALRSVELPTLYAGKALGDRAGDVSAQSLTTEKVGKEISTAHGMVMGSIPGSVTLALLSDEKTWLLPDPTAAEEAACGGAIIVVVTFDKETRKGPAPMVLAYLPSFDGDADIPPSFLEDDAIQMAVKIRHATTVKEG
ncbi:Exosome complex component RRP43 [Perkinsus chesapeaki]|uniref:Ribosomal RNA-processing protein 43 n=1 Tax=Perkinsus chesapeaki TaxID=330153 RepID=A0A7J6KXQ3_PERCH|nr:Exosome complex component RRP43 [Perkinsus chesapeaki]